MKQSKISLWERFKRIIAHAFDLETRLEVQERIERAQFEEQQAQLRLQHHQHIRSLMIEYADEIEQYQFDRQQQALLEEEKRKRQEAIQLYRDNRKKQSAVYYREIEVEAEVIEETTEEN